VSEEDKDDRTEAPSPQRLQKAYDEGTVPLSRDTIMLASLAGGAITLNILGKSIGDALVQLFAHTFGTLDSARPMDLGARLGRPAFLMVAVVAATAAAALIATLAQTRLGFWSQKILPDFKRVFSGGRMKQMFRGEAMVDLLLTLVKSVAVGWVLWDCLRDEIMTLPRMFHLGPAALLTAMFGPLAGALVKLLTTLTVIAGADFALMRYRHNDRLKMTKQELKREAKEDEGDPMIKSRRRRKHRELLKNRIKIEVPRADVVVVNPTHIAIVLRYRTDEDPAPRVTAKGKGETAEKIRELARQHGIPIVENIPLARLLYRKVKVGRVVPAETFKAVAAILAFVYRTLGRTQSQQELRP
jgi:flagellar biosynthesis protein FlhB